MKLFLFVYLFAVIFVVVALIDLMAVDVVIVSLEGGAQWEKALKLVTPGGNYLCLVFHSN